MSFDTYPDAQPLTPEEYHELQIDNDWAHLIIEIDGKFYNDENIYHCAECDAPFAEKASLDDDGHCQLCADDLAAEAKHQRQERPW
jgi:hypothetical protein